MSNHKKKQIKIEISWEYNSPKLIQEETEKKLNTELPYDPVLSLLGRITFWVSQYIALSVLHHLGLWPQSGQYDVALPNQLTQVWILTLSLTTSYVSFIYVTSIY